MTEIPSERLVPKHFTQIPNLVIDEWMPRLSDVELRILLVVIRQTLGWEEDAITGRRKEYDWLSRSQLIERSGRSAKHVSKALKSLIEIHYIVEAVDDKGRKLETARKRARNFGKIFYRYTWREPMLTLFDKPLISALKPRKATKGHTTANQGTKGHTTKGPTTKETPLTKENTLRHEPQSLEKKAHQIFMKWWWETVRATRRINPVVTAKDGAALKRIIKNGMDMQVLEQLALYFLADPSLKRFSPTIATFTSAGILNGLLNRTQNDPEFHRTLDRYVRQYLRPQQAQEGAYEVIIIQTALTALGAKFQAPKANL